MQSTTSSSVPPADATTTNNTNGNNSKGTNVQVVVRCRPLNAEEKKTGQPSVIICDTENKSVKLAYGPIGKKITKNFSFDRVFGMYSRQDEVFDQVVRPIVDETLAGFNCTIFAYGQTGTGKTHTMEGDIRSPEDAGIVPRAVNNILEQLESSGVEFTIRVSFLELCKLFFFNIFFKFYFIFI
jgi:kinesin family member 11